MVWNANEMIQFMNRSHTPCAIGIETISTNCQIVVKLQLQTKRMGILGSFYILES